MINLISQAGIACGAKHFGTLLSIKTVLLLFIGAYETFITTLYILNYLTKKYNYNVFSIKQILKIYFWFG